jgi:hypothetical protein
LDSNWKCRDTKKDNVIEVSVGLEKIGLATNSEIRVSFGRDYQDFAPISGNKMAVSNMIIKGSNSETLLNTIAESYQLETSNPYLKDDFMVTKISKPFAKRIRVHFNYIETENGYDAVSTSVGDVWSGKYYDVWSSWSNGSEISVNLSTDDSNEMNGFKIDKIEYEPTDEYFEVIDEVDSPHDYPNNYNNTWTITCPGAKAIRVHFSYIDTENGHDYVTTSSGDVLSGIHDDLWSSWTEGDTITITLTSNESNTGWGFNIDMIETKTDYDFVGY